MGNRFHSMFDSDDLHMCVTDEANGCPNAPIRKASKGPYYWRVDAIFPASGKIQGEKLAAGSVVRGDVWCFDIAQPQGDELAKELPTGWKCEPKTSKSC